MQTEAFTLIEADTERHFSAIAALMNTQETEPNTTDSLLEWYQKQIVDGIRFVVALGHDEQVLGFNGIYRDNLNIPAHYGLYLIVGEDFRQQGIGNRLYADLSRHVTALGAHTLRIRVRDTCQEGLRFATRRGFTLQRHSIEMMFDLRQFDEQRYDPILRALEAQGFYFTNMAELGDTQEARRKLFALNNAAAATDPGSAGIPPWASFEEFEREVCNSSWYHPDAQIVAIDTRTGEWAAMSAITVFAGADHAYNLFTGTDVRYRGRKLAQVVKALALRRARLFGVNTVRTSHTAQNEAMIAIDTKLGYVHTPGTYVMEKQL